MSFGDKAEISDRKGSEWGGQGRVLRIGCDRHEARRRSMDWVKGNTALVEWRGKMKRTRKRDAAWAGTPIIPSAQTLPPMETAPEGPGKTIWPAKCSDRNPVVSKPEPLQPLHNKSLEPAKKAPQYPGLRQSGRISSEELPNYPGGFSLSGEWISKCSASVCLRRPNQEHQATDSIAEDPSGARAPPPRWGGSSRALF